MSSDPFQAYRPAVIRMGSGSESSTQVDNDPPVELNAASKEEQSTFTKAQVPDQSPVKKQEMVTTGAQLGDFNNDGVSPNTPQRVEKLKGQFDLKRGKSLSLVVYCAFPLCSGVTFQFYVLYSPSRFRNAKLRTNNAGHLSKSRGRT